MRVDETRTYGDHYGNTDKMTQLWVAEDTSVNDGEVENDDRNGNNTNCKTQETTINNTVHLNDAPATNEKTRILSDTTLTNLGNNMENDRKSNGTLPTKKTENKNNAIPKMPTVRNYESDSDYTESDNKISYRTLTLPSAIELDLTNMNEDINGNRQHTHPDDGRNLPTLRLGPKGNVNADDKRDYGYE